MPLRKLLALSAILFVGATSTAQAHTDRYATAQHRYHHAVTVVRWIGKHAATTQYHPDARIKHRWQNAVRFWNQVKKKQWAIMHPQPAVNQSLLSDFLCIHQHEGAWNANTGNSYYGGLQFGWNEWQRFGGRYAPRADLATPAQQIAAAIAYWQVSGFTPWPNTARACGLL